MTSKPNYEELEQRVNALEKELTERKLAEKSLLESETLLKAIMDNAPALISAKDLKGNIIMTNRRFEILDGPTPEEFIGKNVYDLFPFEVADALWKNDLAAIEADAPVESEEIVAHKDKAMHIYHTVKFPLYGETDKAFGTCAISVDITERNQVEGELKKAHSDLERRVVERTADLEKANRSLQAEITERKRSEEALRESEEKYRDIVEGAPVGVFRSTPTGKFLQSNALFARTLGFDTPDELIQGVSNIADIYVHPEQREEAKRQILENGELINLEIEFKHRKDGTVWMSFNVRAVWNATGAVQAYDGFSIDITNRKRAEEALRESEERFRALFESTTSCILFVEDRIMKYINQATLKTFGYTEGEIIGKDTSLIHISQESFEESGRIAYKDIQKQGYWHGELPFKKKDGEIVWMATYLSALPEGGIVAILHDISEQKAAKEALQKSEAFTKAVLDNLPIGTAVNSVDPAVKFEYMNDNFPKFYRTTREALADPDAFWDAVYEEPELREEIKKRVLDDCASGDPERMYWVDVPITRKGGETSFITARNIPVPDKQLMISTVWDVTERKRTEEELRKSEEKYRLLIKSLPSVVYRGYKDWSVEFIDRKVELLTGYSVDEFNSRKMKWSDLILKEDIESAKEHFIQALKTDKSYVREYRIQSKAGNLHWIQERGNIVCANGGEIEYVSGVFFDITRTKELETQLQQSQKMESIGTLAGGIAHDFNNILSSVIGFTELSLDDAEKGTLQYKNLQEVLISGKRAKDLVQQILTFSRQADQEQKPVQVKVVVKEALRLLRASIPSTIEIEQNIQSNALVMGDSTQIHQVLMNLCTNAAHAMADKGGLLTVNLSNVELDSEFLSNYPDLKPGQYINVTVTDTGHGMPPAVLEKIFDPFFTTKEKGEGTGMGLSVVFGTVHSHGGTIHAHSETGIGSTFNVFLPAIERRLEPEDRIEKPIPTGTERILFIDDEPSIMNMGKQILESLGYNVVARTSSIDSLELFKEKTDSFDLIITDMTMPQMTGENLARELMRIRPDIPIILCTGFSARIDEKQAMAMGIRAFISKPILKREIAETIRKVIDSS